jgi:hypothetical protein
MFMRCHLQQRKNETIRVARRNPLQRGTGVIATIGESLAIAEKQRRTV